MSSDVVPAPLPEGDHPSPLSYTQEQFWLLARLNPGLPIDNLPWLIDMPPALDLAALKRSLEDLVQRHEVLRTRFVFDDGRPIQLVQPFVSLELPVVSLEDLPAGEQDREMSRLAEAELRKPFDLERGPPFRAVLVRRSGGLNRLVLIVHHIAIDTFSAHNVLFPELIAIYEAHAFGKAPPLLPENLQLRHYALWQRRRAAEGALDEAMRYWRRRLEGMPAVLPLPTDRPRPAIPSVGGDERSHLLSSDLIDALRRLGQEERSTLFTVLFAGFFALLYRHTDQEDISVGTFIADRSSSNKRSILGPLVNTVVARTHVRGGSTFREVIRDVQDALAEARNHSELPFEVLVSELRPRRNLGQNPLFQVAFNYLRSAPVGEWSITHRGVTTGTANMDLVLDLQGAPEGICIHAQYSTDLFDGTTIEQMLEHYEVLLRGAVDDPQTCISALPLLTDGERRLLNAWNEASTPLVEITPQATRSSGVPGERVTFPGLFELQVTRTPDATALIVGEEELSYRELNAWANRVAHRLRALGVGPEARVCILLERSTEMMVAILGVLKAGGAYVPVDPAFPKARISFLLDDARPSVVLTQRSLVELLPETAPILALDAESSAIYKESEQNLDVEIQPENSAYIIYTSGSTGNPKGVVIEHRNTAAFLSSVADIFSKEELSYVLGSTSICFDVSVFELFLPLCRGGAIVLARNALALPELPLKNRVALLSMVPSAMAAVLDTCGIPSSVQTVVLAGEALHRSLAERVLALGHVRRLYNMYGPTETTTYSTIAHVRSGEALTIGRAIANTHLCVLDRNGNQVPVGIPGELCIAGPGVTRGYLNRPELTAERFTPDPLGAGERRYRTGDLVRFTPAGELEFIGRIDHQVKLRGFRIELGEIEATLTQHPSVREAVVLTVEDTPGDARLVAYAVLDPGVNKSSITNALRSHAQSLLPGYMVPATFVFLSELPRTTSGKIDRRALLLQRREPEARALHAEPKEEMEVLIANIWRTVIGVERVGVHDNFFDLGGNSLLLVRVYEALRKSVKKPFTILQLFAFPTIHTLARALSSEPVADASLGRAQDRAQKQKLALARQRERAHLKRGKQ